MRNQNLKTTRLPARQVCSVCGKSPVSGYNRPHSLHRTKRTVKPNTQKIQGQIICTRCLRTKSKRKSL